MQFSVANHSFAAAHSKDHLTIHQDQIWTNHFSIEERDLEKTVVDRIFYI